MHVVRLGTAKEEHLIHNTIQKSDTLFFKANLVAHMPDGLSAFLYNWNPDPSYIIDPYLYAFQQDPQQFYTDKIDDQGRMIQKRSIKKLLDYYGDPIKTVISEVRSLTPDDFNKTSYEDVVTRICDFQCRKLTASGTDLSSFFEFFGVPESTPPAILITPSLSLESISFDWLPVNVELANTTAKLYSHSRIYAQLIIDVDILLDPHFRKLITVAYNQLPVQGVLLWVSGFSEHNASIEELQAYLALLSALQKPKIIMYGSYFSVVLQRHFQSEYQVEGVTHGPGYGEEREVDPASGGFPAAKFYLPSVHKRLDYATAVFAVREFLGSNDSYIRNICGCTQCMRLIEDLGATGAFASYGEEKTLLYKRQGTDVSVNIPTVDAQNLSAIHYLLCKEDEFHNECSLSETFRSFEQSLQYFRSRIPYRELRHLDHWLKVLRPQ